MSVFGESNTIAASAEALDCVFVLVEQLPYFGSTCWPKCKELLLLSVFGESNPIIASVEAPDCVLVLVKQLPYFGSTCWPKCKELLLLSVFGESNTIAASAEAPDCVFVLVEILPHFGSFCLVGWVILCFITMALEGLFDVTKTPESDSDPSCNGAGFTSLETFTVPSLGDIVCVVLDSITMQASLCSGNLYTTEWASVAIGGVLRTLILGCIDPVSWAVACRLDCSDSVPGDTHISRRSIL